MKKAYLGLALVMMIVSLAAGAGVQQMLKSTAQRASGAFCLVECSVDMNGQTSPHKGIGICIDTSGLLLTMAIPAQAKAESISNIRLTLPGVKAKQMSAELLGMDSLTGIAFLRAKEEHNWSVVAFQKNANVSLGDMVVSAGLNIRAAGAPLVLGLAYVSSEQRIPQRIFCVTGGALSMVGSVVFNAEGRAIGLVTSQPFLPYQVYSRGGSYRPSMLRNLEQAVCFTPVDEFVRVLTNIPQGGVVRRPSWVGGFLVAVPEGLRQAKGLAGPAVMIDQILPNGPATKAGLKDRDIVIGINGVPLESLGSDELTAHAVRQKIGRMSPGTEITLTVGQQGRQRDVTLKLEPMPVMPSEAPKLLNTTLGLAMREKVPLDQTNSDPSAKRPGLLVIAVGAKSPADWAGLHNGDLVIAIDDKSVSTVSLAEELFKARLEKKPPENIKVTVARGKETKTLTIRAPGN